MSQLELKIPPLIVLAATGTMIWFISILFPTTHLTYGYENYLAAVFLVLGLFFPLAGIWSFKKANTTANPMQPGGTSSLVQSGVYRLSRNPMYLGFLLILIALGLFLSSLYSLLIVVVFVIYINKYQVVPEERILLGKFGTEFASYKKRVRRWI